MFHKLIVSFKEKCVDCVLTAFNNSCHMKVVQVMRYLIYRYPYYSYRIFFATEMQPRLIFQHSTVVP